MAVSLGLVTLIAIAEGVIIWRLLDRLLLVNNIPKSLGPVRVAPPTQEEVQKKETRRKIMTVPIQ